jgi:uncharacterized repeat protein (TIGR01451 family)
MRPAKSLHRLLGGACALTSLLVAGWAGPAIAAGGSYATTGTGTYAQSLWWLDFSSYSDTTALTAGGQAVSFTLPSGTGTLTTTVKRTGTGTVKAVAEPAWTGGGAFGHGAYNAITGKPIFYWLSQSGTATVSLTALSVKDAAGNPRTFGFFAADGENTNSPEKISYTSTATWKLIDTVNNYASYNGGVPTLTGLGTATVAESATTGTDGNYNAAIVLGTQNPTQVSAALTGSEAVLFALSIPTVTLNVSVASRDSATDQFTGSLGYTSPAANLSTTTTSGTGTTATTGAISVLGTNSITLTAAMASGSASPLSYYTGSIACTNSGPGAVAYGGTNTVLPSGAGTSFPLTPQTGDSITCTLTLTPVTLPLSGTVYSDANHNSTLDASETGTGISGLYMKIAPSSAGVCQTPATAAAAVNATTGAYTFAAVSARSYCLTLTNNSTLTNTTPYLPAGWVGTEAPSGVRQITTSVSPSPVQNLGLYNGSQLTLLVFADTGTGSGTANDGVQNGGEAGLNGITVTASAGGTAVATASTNANGNAVLWLTASISGAVTLLLNPPSGDLATGGSAGNTGGSYTRPSVSFTYAPGITYTGVIFGLIPPASLAPNGDLTAQPGTTLFFPHTFTAGSAGQLTLSTSAASNPTLSGWKEELYLDSTCAGQFTTGDPLVNAAISVTAGQRVCLLLKEFVPAGAPLNAQDKVTLSASLAYSGSAAPATTVLTGTDVTTVVVAGAILFTKQVQNLTTSGAYGTTNTALPGHTLQYLLTITNLGSAPLAAVVVNDATPAFTTFLSAACPATLPTSMTGCGLTTQPASGAQGSLQWTFTGTLAPGAQTSVTYQVVTAQ